VLDTDEDRETERTSGSAVDVVVGRVRALIKERGLRVGDVLPSEAELSNMFAASRNTVREAVRTLKAYGVVESRQKVGAVMIDRRQAAMTDLFAFAMEISPDTFQDIQGFRRLTEMNLGETLIGRISDAELDKLAQLNSAMAAKTDVERASELDFEFHQALIDAAGNRTLSEIYGMLRPVIQRLMRAGKEQREALDLAAAEHSDIIEALREKDRIAYVYHMNRHLQAGLKYIGNEERARP
jgi:DNA-binding FadR family transcriptional regulator